MWNFPWSVCLRLGFWSQCIWFGFWGPNWFDRKNQSRATLWVWDACLVVGLLPLMIILITASLSSNTYNKASWRADWTCEGTASMSFITSIFLWDLWCLYSSLSGFTDRSETREIFPRTETIRSHSSRAGKPSKPSPVSREIISDSVELWETAVCFLHIQLIGTNVWLPKTHNVPPEVDFESSRSPANQSWNSPNLHCVAVFPTWQYCLYSQVWWIYEINRFRRLSQALVHFVMDRASLFTDQRISRLPIRARYKHFRTIWEQTFDNSPTDFVSSSLKLWSSMHGVDTFRLVRQLTLSFHTLLCMTSHVIGPWRNTKILREW